MSTLKKAITAKQVQWSNEAKVSAARAILMGIEAKLVTYPSGLKQMRFAEPFKEFGMHYEVSPEIWNEVKSNCGKIAA